MADPDVKKKLAAARASLAAPVAFEDFLARLAAKDRVSAERHVNLVEAEPSPDRARAWRRLSSSLMSLANHAAKFLGRQTMQFYIADGKYRMQVFALEDVQDGNLVVYCPDVLDDATKAGIISKSAEGYVIDSGKQSLSIELLDGGTTNAGPHFKDLLGWNRKALRITLPAAATAAQIDATELICALATQNFPKNPATATNSGAEVIPICG